MSIEDGFFREANVVYLLLKYFSKIRYNDDFMYLPYKISTSGISTHPIYSDENGEIHKEDLNKWKSTILEMFNNNSEITFDNETSFDIELGYKKGVEQHKSSAKRWFYIEAKGDYIRNGKPVAIKKKIQSGLGQLILAAAQFEEYFHIGSNFCLAIPWHWEDTLRKYIDNNRLFKKIIEVFGRQEVITKNGKKLELNFFRFILIKDDELKILYLPKNKAKLEVSDIIKLE
ncbi:MAG: hypothetical protein ACFFCM_20205 [Promethearchaeota archaeon]